MALLCANECLSTIRLAWQVIHKEQYDDKRQVLQEATTVDDMYDMLAVYEQKVITADQVSLFSTPMHARKLQFSLHYFCHPSDCIRTHDNNFLEVGQPQVNVVAC